MDRFYGRDGQVLRFCYRTMGYGFGPVLEQPDSLGESGCWEDFLEVD
jgi:hypothetical protein